MEERQLGTEENNEQENLYSEEYKNLEKNLAEIMSKETAYMKKAKKLKKELMEAKKKFRDTEKTVAQTQQYLADLKKDLIKSENQLAIAHESEAQLQTTVIETERKIDFLENERRKIIERREAKDKPLYNRLTREIEEFESQISQLELNVKKEEEKRLAYIQKITEIQKQLNESEQHNNKLKEEIKNKEDEPIMAQKQLDIVLQAVVSSERDIRIKSEKIERLDNTVNELKKQLSDIENEKNNLTDQMYNLNLNMEKIDEEIKNIKTSILQKKDENAIAVSNKFAISHEELTKKEEQKIESDMLKTLQRQEDEAVKKAYKVEIQIKNLETEIHNLEKQKQMLLIEKKRVEEKLGKVKADKMILERDVDILSNDLLQNEHSGDSLSKDIRVKDKEVEDLEMSINKISEEERELAKGIIELENERERKSRAAAKQKLMLDEIRGESKILTFVNGELQKKLVIIENEINAKNDLYSFMRQERNKCSKAIQDSEQTLAEIREKNRILENELNVLKAQNNEKNKELNEDKSALNKKSKESTVLHSESSKLKMLMHEKEYRKMALQSEIDELNMYIDTTEESMIFLKNRYEFGVQERNYTGIQLIDRNDELCILYEKANIQENIIKNGEIELQKKEQELNMLSLELENLRRETQLVYKRVPEFEALKKEKEDLQRQIEETTKSIKELSEKLEDPSNKERWRELEGYVPTKEELKEKLQELEEKLNQRSEQLMEKNLILQEITQSSDESRMEAIQGRDQMYDLAMNMGKVQARIRELNKKMISTLSELSIYQATLMELEKNNNELAEMVKTAGLRLENGEPPSQEHEEQLLREERLRYKRQLEMELLAEKIAYEKSLPPTVTHSTAIQRPNAYIPDDMLGLPKPYPQMFRPMMYSEPGATMRHIKKQNNNTKPVVI